MPKVRMTLKLKKCFLIFYAIDYLGHVITPRRLYTAIKTIDAIRVLKYSTAMSELQYLLILRKFCRRLVSKFSQMPLSQRKTIERQTDAIAAKWQRGTDGKWLGTKAHSSSCLRIAEIWKTTLIETDICNEQLACVISQKQESVDSRPIGYQCRTFHDAWNKYSKSHESVWQSFGLSHCIVVLLVKIVLSSDLIICLYGGFGT